MRATGLRVQLKKGRDGPPTLACVRPDGTRTWARLHGFFPIHDLTHYAVESVLGFDAAFFGLIARGASIAAFTEPGAPARLPVQARWAEQIVGLLDLERGMSRLLGADEFTAALGQALERHGLPPFRPLTDAELGRVRTLRGELQARWRGLTPGATLEISFPAPA